MSDLAIILLRRGLCVMPKNKNKKKDSVEKQNSTLKFWAQIIVPILFSLVIAGVNTYIYVRIVNHDIKSINKSIDSINQEIKDIKGDTSDLKVANAANQSDFRNLKEQFDNIQDNIDALEKSIFQDITYTPTKKFVQQLSMKNFDFSVNTLSIKDDDIIAKDQNGKKYTAKKLADKKILLPYIDDGKEVYFYGQFNKKYHWEGDCVINTYDGNKLYAIMEANYDDGVLVSYNQATWHKNSGGKFVWNISLRNHNEKSNENIGDTWTYYKKNDIKKNFNRKTVKPKNILNMNQFKEKIKNSKLESYYHGVTSNGLYNDDTGTAYLIKYAVDDTVRTLYCGCFKDGKFNDNSGNAWYIARGESDSQYVYFKGKFKNGIPIESSTNKRKYISNKKIHNIIDKMEFNCSVQLYDPNKNNS